MGTSRDIILCYRVFEPQRLVQEVLRHGSKAQSTWSNSRYLRQYLY